MAWVFDWHGQDSRATGPLDVACTVTQTYAGMQLLVLRDERGGIAGINTKQLEPIMDELKNGQYMVWYRRTMSNGKPYYVLKCGMYLRMAVLPIVFDDVFAAALDEIRAGMMLDALDRPKKREDENHDD